VVELVTSGVTTVVRGAYDPAGSYSYGDLVTGSDGKNYVYLCQQATVVAPGNGNSGGGTGGGTSGGTGSGTVGNVPTLPQGYTVIGAPAIFLTTTVDGFPVVVTQGTSFMEIFYYASEPPIYPTVSQFPASPTSANVFAIARDTGDVSYYSTARHGWVDVGQFVGEVDGHAARTDGTLQPPRASVVVQSYADLATAPGTAGQRYLVIDTWEVVART
jgi:hypothetical protein